MVSIARHFFMSGDGGAEDPELTKFVVADAVDFVEKMAEEGGKALQIFSIFTTSPKAQPVNQPLRHFKRTDPIVCQGFAAVRPSQILLATSHDAI